MLLVPPVLELVLELELELDEVVVEVAASKVLGGVACGEPRSFLQGVARVRQLDTHQLIRWYSKMATYISNLFEYWSTQPHEEDAISKGSTRSNNGCTAHTSRQRLIRKHRQHGLDLRSG